MRTQLHLSIANPCTESWDQMTPNPQGRFCSACSKTVVNFATMTDQQVLDWMANHPGSVCGRFHPDQLDRPMTATPQKPGPGRYWHYFIAFLLSSSELAAQTKPAKPPTTQQIPFGGEGRYQLGDTVMGPKLTSPPAILRGRLVDDNGHPVSFASIMYKEHTGVAADADGCFSIPAVNLAGVHTLTISAAGYETLKVDVNTFHLDGTMRTLTPMKMQPVFVGGVVAVAHRRRRKPIADTLSLLKDTIVSCLSLPKNNFSIYPNPVPRGNSVAITAQLDKPGTYAVQLFDVSGNLLVSAKADREQLSGAFPLTLPATLSPGTYLIRVFHPDMKKPYTRQVIVL